MVRILTICQRCGDVEVTLDDIRLQVWVDRDWGEYTLQCPTCATATVWPANPGTIDLLVASGAEPETVSPGPGRPPPTGVAHRPRTTEGSTSSGRRRRRFQGRHPRRP